MKKLDMNKAINRYNNILMDCAWEHKTIGTRFSEDTENWTLADMVAECEYLLSCYYESGHTRYEDRLDSKEDYATWLSETGKLKRFINAYKQFV